MEKARVAIFDDEDIQQQVLSRRLAEAGHQVVSQETTLQGALKAVRDMAAGILLCDVIVLDGNLSSARQDGHDARVVVSTYKEFELEQKIITFSNGDMDEYDLRHDVDVAVPKMDGGQGLVAAVNAV